MLYNSALTPFVLAALVLPAVAMDQEIEGPRLGADTAPFDTLPSGPIAVGRFSSAHDGDWLAVVDGQLLIGVQNARFAHVVAGPTGQLAVLALPRPTHARDLVLGTGSQGLVSWAFDASTASATATVIASGWSGVTGLAVDAHGVVYGWSASAGQLLRYDTATSSTLSALTVSAGIRDVVAVDWDGDGTDEIALRRDASVSVLSRTGGSLWSASATSVDRIATVRGFGTERDLLTRSTYGQDGARLATWNDDNLTGPELVLDGGPVDALLAADVVGLASGAPDGEDDLLMAGLDGNVWVLQRSIHPDYRLFPDLWEPGRAYFSLPSSTTSVALGAGDLDLDGDADTLFGLPELGRVEFQLDTRIQRGAYLPGGSIHAELDGNGLDVTLSSSSPGLATGATHLLVEVWAMAGNGAAVLSEPIAKGTIALGSLATHAFTFAQAAPLQSNGHPLVAVSYRAVTLDSNGGVAHAWPASATYATTADLSTLDPRPEVHEAEGEHAFGVIGGQQVPRAGGEPGSQNPPPLE